MAAPWRRHTAITGFDPWTRFSHCSVFPFEFQPMFSPSNCLPGTRGQRFRVRRDAGGGGEGALAAAACRLGVRVRLPLEDGGCARALGDGARRQRPAERRRRTAQIPLAALRLALLGASDLSGMCSRFRAPSDLQIIDSPQMSGKDV